MNLSCEEARLKTTARNAFLWRRWRLLTSRVLLTATDNISQESLNCWRSLNITKCLRFQHPRGLQTGKNAFWLKMPVLVSRWSNCLTLLPLSLTRNKSRNSSWTHGEGGNLTLQRKASGGRMNYNRPKGVRRIRKLKRDQTGSRMCNLTQLASSRRPFLARRRAAY